MQSKNEKSCRWSKVWRIWRPKQRRQLKVKLEMKSMGSSSHKEQKLVNRKSGVQINDVEKGDMLSVQFSISNFIWNKNNWAKRKYFTQHKLLAAKHLNGPSERHESEAKSYGLRNQIFFVTHHDIWVSCTSFSTFGSNILCVNSFSVYPTGSLLSLMIGTAFKDVDITWGVRYM